MNVALVCIQNLYFNFINIIIIQNNDIKKIRFIKYGVYQNHQIAGGNKPERKEREKKKRNNKSRDSPRRRSLR